MDYILKIIPEENYNHDISLKLYDWILKSMKHYKSELKIDLKIYLSKALSIFINKKKEKIEDFFKNLKKKLNDKDLIEIFIYFLDHNKLEQKHKDQLINYILENKKNRFDTNDLTIIPHVISKLNNKNDINLILKKLNVIKEEEFYSSEITENIKILNDLIKNDFFESKNQKNLDEYSQKTKNVLLTIKTNFEQNNFSFEKAYHIYNNLIAIKDVPNYKLKLLFLSKDDNDERVKKFYTEFQKNVLKFIEQINNLEKIKIYLEEFSKIQKKKRYLKLRN